MTGIITSKVLSLGLNSLDIGNMGTLIAAYPEGGLSSVPLAD
jgi:hypothetical protein